MIDPPSQRPQQHEAFRRQLISLLPHLRAFARGLCGRSDYADDLVQETALKAWTARERFDPDTNMRAWAFTIMRNHFLNDRRRLSRETAYEEGIAQTVMIEKASQEGYLHLSDTEKALQKLPGEQREALLLVGASGFSYAEAADICHVATGTMKSRVSRGRAALAALLGDGANKQP